MMQPDCTCGEPCRLTDAHEIYPHRPDLGGAYWLCDACGAYVGCHPDTSRPLGTPADKTLRGARSAAHAAFDPLWRKGKWSRRRAYRWLAQSMDLPEDACHIGMFNEQQCRDVIALANQQRFGRFAHVNA